MTTPQDDLDPGDESRVTQQQGTEPVVRATPGDGPPPPEAPAHGEAPVVEGTGAGDPLAGIRLDESEAADAVHPDDEPLR